MNRRLVGLIVLLGALVVLKTIDVDSPGTPTKLVAAVERRPTPASVVRPHAGRAEALGNADGDAAEPTVEASGLPWPVERDPFRPDPPPPPAPPRIAPVVATPAPPPPAPPAALPPRPPTPRPTVFGLWRDESSGVRAMMATPNGVVVAAVGDSVMSLKVVSIDATGVALVDPSSAERMILSVPALPPEPRGARRP